jgi:hypothetical protein
MSVTVTLKEIVDELEILMDRSTAYLNVKTGEVIAISHDDMEMVEDEVDEDDLPEWQRKWLPRAREVLESDDYQALPSKFDIHEWAIMNRFALSIDDKEISDELYSAIRGPGAFRLFKNLIHRYRIQKAWDAYRTAAIERIAIEWLEEKGILYRKD